MKKLSLFLLSLIMLISLTACDSDDYKKATELYNNGQYSEAAAIFEQLGDYEDSSEKVKQCKYQQSLALATDREFDRAIKAFTELGDYEDCTERLAAVQNEKAVVEAMEGQVWYYNGGSKTKLNSISFDKKQATISKIHFDGNGKQDDGNASYPYKVGNKAITVKTDDGDLTLSYQLTDDSITLDQSQFFTPAQVEKGLQGYWRYSSISFSKSEHNIYIKNGSIKYEKATASAAGDGYYYYGPYSGSIKINFGGFDTDVFNGANYGFNIISGKPTLMYFDDPCKSVKLKKLPGEKGYNRLLK